MDKYFKISLSVGTLCDAYCPYCDLKMFSNSIASSTELISSVSSFISELSDEFSAFRIRLTGGEPGLVLNISEFIQFVNKNQQIHSLKIFTKGDVFDNVEPEILKKKTEIIEHLIHDIIDQKFIRYDKKSAPETLEQLTQHIENRKKQCFKYKCAVVDKDLSCEMKSQLIDSGVTLFPLINRKNYQKVSTYLNDNAQACFYNKKEYVYDVSNQMFFNCCEMKNPEYGYSGYSIKEFLNDSSQFMYEQCMFCNKFSEE